METLNQNTHSILGIKDRPCSRSEAIATVWWYLPPSALWKIHPWRFAL